MTTDFGKLITAMVTPFTEQGEVNYTEAVNVAGYLVETGSDTILLAGTTGESPTLTHAEEFELFKTVKQALGSTRHVMAGAGSNCTQTAIDATHKAAQAGVDSVLHVVPYYNKPSQEGIVEHFKAIEAHTELPIMLYNIPGRTGTNMEIDTIERCATFSGIHAIKEAGGSVEVVKQLCERLPKEFAVYSGDDGITFPCLEVGAKGVVSVAAHCAGDAIKQMLDTFHAGNITQAKQIHERLRPLFDVLFITTNPTPVKAALRLMGKDVGSCRLPLIDVTASETQQLTQVLTQLQLI